MKWCNFSYQKTQHSSCLTQTVYSCGRSWFVMQSKSREYLSTVFSPGWKKTSKQHSDSHWKPDWWNSCRWLSSSWRQRDPTYLFTEKMIHWQPWALARCIGSVLIVITLNIFEKDGEKCWLLPSLKPSLAFINVCQSSVYSHSSQECLTPSSFSFLSFVFM